MILSSHNNNDLKIESTYFLPAPAISARRARCLDTLSARTVTPTTSPTPTWTRRAGATTSRWVIPSPLRGKLTRVRGRKWQKQNQNITSGIRNQIFQPIYQNSDGYYALAESFLTANVMIKCDASWTSEIYDNFNQYVQGKLRLSTTGYGIQALPETDVKKSFSQVSFEASMPSLFTRDEGFSTSVTNARDFFKQVFSNWVLLG